MHFLSIENVILFVIRFLYARLCNCTLSYINFYIFPESFILYGCASWSKLFFKYNSEMYRTLTIKKKCIQAFLKL